MLSERDCILNNRKTADVLSAQMIISCDSLDFGCNGGHLDTTMDFLSYTKVPKTSCDPKKFEYLEQPLDSCPLDNDETS